MVNNVISLATVPIILDKGAKFYQDFGMGKSRGTLTIQLAGNIKYGGLVEKAFGMTLREAIYDFGGGTATGRPLRAVQVGGPLGAYFPESLLDTPLDYEAFAAKKGLVGHGGIVVFDDTVDLAKQARFAMEFCAIESCGKCTPCRIGSTRGVEVIDRIVANQDRTKNLQILDDLCELMLDGSLCALGGLTPYPVLSALQHFPEIYESRPPAHSDSSTVTGENLMALIQEIDYGTPASVAQTLVTLEIDGKPVTVPAGTSVMRAAVEAGVSVPKLCATDSEKAFGSCRLCLVEIDGRRGTPASCTTLAEPGMKVRTSSPKLHKLRKGVMELYISDHPLDCLTCAANGDCELAGYGGRRRVCAKCATAMKARITSKQPEPKDNSNPYFHVRAVEVHRVFALRARLRGSAGHVRADDSGPRIRIQSLGGRQAVSGFRVRLLRRVRAGLPHGDADGESRCLKKASPTTASSPPAPTAASAVPSKRKCRAAKWCA